MSYRVSENITSDLNFSCDDGEIMLTTGDGVEIPLNHQEMQKLVVLWLKCTDMEFTPMQKVTLHLDLDMRRSK